MNNSKIELISTHDCILNTMKPVYFFNKDLNVCEITYGGKKYIIDTEDVFKIINCEKYSLIEMQNHIFHRGKKNETNETRTMFQITLTEKTCKLNIMDHMVIEDAELDDENKDLIIKNRTL